HPPRRVHTLSLHDALPIYLHSHSGNDGFWFVLSGRARFYDENDNVFADVGPHEGVLVPHSTPYWFESADDATTLEILHVGSRTKDRKSTRLNSSHVKISYA